MKNFSRVTCLASVIAFGLCVSAHADKKPPYKRDPKEDRRNAKQQRQQEQKQQRRIEQQQKVQQQQRIEQEVEQELIQKENEQLDKLFYALFCLINPNIESLKEAQDYINESGTKCFLHRYINNKGLEIDGVLALMKKSGDEDGEKFLNFVMGKFADLRND
jgi:hemolysin activation/secretion protein